MSTPEIAPAEELYLHDHVPQWGIAGPDGEEHVAVTAQAFMEMQRERDAYRRVLALVNAWRTEPRWWENPDRLHTLLEKAGMSWEDGQAMAGLVASFSRPTSATDEQLLDPTRS